MDSGVVQQIEATPGVMGGKPRIAGHRIRVSDIVVLHDRRGLSPDEIEAEFEAEAKLVAEMQAQHGSRLQSKLKG